MPKFFYTKHGVSLAQIGPPVMVIYLMSDIGSITGGWFSSFLLKRGWSKNASRKTAMLVAAIIVIPVYFASQTESLWVAVGLIGLALAGHQAWSANLLTITTDMFPQNTIASVVGIGSMLGAIGGMFGATAAGLLLQYTHSYTPLFIAAGSIYLFALACIQILAPQLKSIDNN